MPSYRIRLARIGFAGLLAIAAFTIVTNSSLSAPFQMKFVGWAAPLITISPDRHPSVNVETESIESPVPICTPASGLIISEFRLRGNTGVNDEFIELYNNTDQPITVCTADGSSGWAIATADGLIRAIISVNTVIPARAHYLVVGSGYSLSGYASADLSYTPDIPDNIGIAIFNTANSGGFTTTARLDAVGFTTDANSLYREGTGLTPIGTANGQYSFIRKLNSGLPQDTAIQVMGCLRKLRNSAA
jgi:hypothetical protein